MGRMIFDLTDDDRAALERHRVRLGLRSHAETLRALIRREPLRLGGQPIYPDETARLPQAHPPEPVKPAPKKLNVRLKGEWKPR